MTNSLTPLTDYSERTCRNKRKFATKELCEESIQKQMETQMVTVKLKSYWCRWCSNWHKTKRPIAG